MDDQQLPTSPEQVNFPSAFQKPSKKAKKRFSWPKTRFFVLGSLLTKVSRRNVLDTSPVDVSLPRFFKATLRWGGKRTHQVGLHFENQFKNRLVDWLLWKRGALGRPAVHASLFGLVILGLVGGGVIGGNSIVSGSYPGVPQSPLLQVSDEDRGAAGQVLAAEINPITIISDKPRDKAIEYVVESGDTVSTIAEKFGVTTETVLWENNLREGSLLSVGNTIQILPVSGVAHTVKSGETIYSVAKAHQAEAQAILDFPFNDVGEDLALKVGQVLIVPNGAPTPSAPKPRPVQYLARDQADQKPVSGSGQFLWPASGQLSQYYSWYHPADDISNLGGGPIIAADGGKVIVAGWPDNSGYGNRVIIDHGNGFTTLYAHMSRIDVGVGDYVSRGQRIGMMGSTGRSTGTHLHFEIRKNGAVQNPLSYLP